MDQGTGDTTAAVPNVRRPAAWAAYAACALALLYAGVSFYWAAGDTAGLGAIGGDLEELGQARDPVIIALLWATCALKVVAGLLALALVRPWGRLFPRWMLLAAAGGGAALLAGYGGLYVAVQGLVVAGIIETSGPVDWTPFLWHLLVWDPWFLLMGILLGVAAWGYQRGSGSKVTRISSRRQPVWRKSPIEPGDSCEEISSTEEGGK